jgi:small-conductance mechanosensitive channel
MPEADTATIESSEPVFADSLVESIPALSDWLPAEVIPYWELLSQVPIVGALVIAVFFFLLAVALRYAIFRTLGRLAGLTLSSVDDRILADLKRPVFTTVFFLGLGLAVQAAEIPAGTRFVIVVLVSVVIASWMRAVLRVSGSFLSIFESQRRFNLIEARTVPVFDLTIKLLTILVGSYLLLMVWGVNPVGWLASAGIVGIAVGFAAKDTLANLFSGFFIVADAPYKIGDYINLDSGERGKVSAIGLRSTRLLTRDDVEITIPNGVIANAKIVNESGGPYVKIRNRIAVGVAYGSDVDRVCEVLVEVAEQHERTCAHPAPRVRMRGFGASSLDFELLVWIDHPELRGLIAHDLYMEIYKALGREGIEIPYTKHDVFIKELPGHSAPASLD